MTASSQFSIDTAPYYGRLHYSEAFLFDQSLTGAGAWVALDHDTKQYLQIDLSERKVIMSIGTQGRQGARQFVKDFYLHYSDSDVPSQWISYKDIYGADNLFDGNMDDNTVKINYLKYPIVARFVRFYPQRWYNKISLRVELFGCKYLPNLAYFDGSNRIDFRLDLPGRAVQTFYDTIRFRFRTRNPNGLILFGDDDQGDYILIHLFRGRLRIEINLGVPFTTGLQTIFDNSLDAGSFLDDGQWHDVNITRFGKILNVTVDRIETWRNISSAFVHLNMNRNLSLGGVSSFGNLERFGIRQNFMGCIEEMWFNGINIIRDALRQDTVEPGQDSLSWWELMGYPTPAKQLWWPRPVSKLELNITGFVISGSLSNKCPSTALDSSILTFPGRRNFMTLSHEAGTNFYCRLIFRTFNMDGTLIYHHATGDFKKFFFVAITAKGKLRFSMTWKDVINPIDFEIENNDTFSQLIQFADGMWHNLELSIEFNSIKINIDSRVFSTKIRFETNLDLGSLTFIGGGRPLEPAFLGCIKDINLNFKDILWENYLKTSFGANTDIVNGSCAVYDRCSPNPCKHQAPCTQIADTFQCDCSRTGYEGSICHQSIRSSSCSEVALLYSRTNSEMTTIIDLDGSGILAPITVRCRFTSQGVITEVPHDLNKEEKVDNFDPPGSYQRDLNYGDQSELALNELIRRSDRCQQPISFKCYNTRLLSRDAPLPIISQGIFYDRDDLNGVMQQRPRAFGWWIGRKRKPHYYWGGSVPGHNKCACGVKNSCEDMSPTCNCDGKGNPPKEDSGLLEFKNDLPVLGVRFGDTGSLVDDQYAFYSVGTLECTGDKLFDNTVTFRRADASMELEAIYSETEFDLSFLFKTTIYDAVFLQNVDVDDGRFFEVRIRLGNSIRFSFNVGNGVQILEVTTANWLNNNHWHAVRLERNRKTARLKIDEQEPSIYEEPTDRAFQPLRFTKPLFLGSTIAYTDGFLGCISNLIINGVIQDIRGKVERNEFTYGLSAGCKPKCDQEPCLNRGECYEYYSHYYCECGLTPFRGYICGRELGASFSEPYMVQIKFNFSGDKLGMVDEYISVAFKTQDKGGILMQMSSANHKEYIIVKLNKNGGISVEFNVGYEWQEFTTQSDIDLTNNQHHDVTVWRTNLGKIWHIKVDDYDVVDKDYSWMLSDDSDTRLDNPTFMYIGRNDSNDTSNGFRGCLFRAQWNNIFPIKMIYSWIPHSNIEFFPNETAKEKLQEDKCGIEEVMPKPDPIEVRPYPTIPPNITVDKDPFKRDSYAWIAIVVVLLIVFLIMIILFFCFCRNFTIRRGDYSTREDSGTKKLLSPDLAVKYGQSGQANVGHREWFM